MTRPSDLARFTSKVQRSETCWLWTASNRADGYGRFWLEGKLQYAHRVAYAWANGPIPKGLFVDHTCHNPSCVRPDHLRAATNKENLENRRGANRNSATGVRGVSWDAAHKRYVGQVKHGQSSVWVGFFDDLSEAESAVIATRNELFTHNDLDRV